MIITKKAISRRAVLRGLGTTLALPLLDGMVPALTAWSRTPANPTKRFGIVYVANGMVMENWTPKAVGAGFEITPILQPLAPYRERLLVVSGLNNNEDDKSHETGSTKFLTGMPPKSTQGADLQAGVSVDQVAARAYGQHTQLASLELALDAGEFGGTCGAGYSCAYTNTICWRGPSTPLPMETNPRVVFERLLGDGGSTDPAARMARMRKDRSILDSVTDKLSRLNRDLGARDQSKLSEYLEAVRDVERRIEKAEAQGGQELPDVSQPAGIPASFEEHAKLMFDLQVLAYQTDLTRVITFMVGREFSGRTYPEIGISEAHHPLSHHQYDPEKLAKLTKLQTYQASIFAYYLDKLNSVKDGDGTLLDTTMILYGGGLSDSNAHLATNLPVVLVGGTGSIQGGRHLKFGDETPMANLHVTMLHKLGVEVESLGDSTGELSNV